VHVHWKSFERLCSWVFQPSPWTSSAHSLKSKPRNPALLALVGLLDELASIPLIFLLG
jgi:hypothetical protein